MKAAASLLLCLTTVASAQTTIPFCAGVTVVSAVNDIKGDYESIVTIESIQTDRVNIAYSSEIAQAGSIKLISTKRTILLSDMMNARLLHNWFSQSSQRAYPGTTSYQASVALLRKLKATGEADIGLVDRTNSDVPADKSKHPNIFDFEHIYRIRRTGTTRLPVVINDKSVSLPVITAAGEYMGDRIEFAFLDDALHPLSLQFTLTPLGGKPITSRVVKVFHRCSAASISSASMAMSSLERSLMESRKADVYQIYFDFNSDHIRDESAPTIKEIAAILNRHPDWKLVINGHTDNIGGDAYNLDLSRRRAASVRQELVQRYRIATARLTTGGAGSSQPKATNTTLEGRAQNRRVELIRL